MVLWVLKDSQPRASAFLLLTSATSAEGCLTPILFVAFLLSLWLALFSWPVLAHGCEPECLLVHKISRNTAGGGREQEPLASVTCLLILSGFIHGILAFILKRLASACYTGVRCPLNLRPRKTALTHKHVGLSF